MATCIIASAIFNSPPPPSRWHISNFLWSEGSLQRVEKGRGRRKNTKNGATNLLQKGGVVGEP